LVLIGVVVGTEVGSTREVIRYYLVCREVGMYYRCDIARDNQFA
jgi:hypothetical protein